MTAVRAVMLVKKVTFFGEFSYLNSSCIRKSFILLFLSSSWDKFTLCSKADGSVGFRPPCWCPSVWAQAWRRHTNLYKFGYHISPHILLKKNCCNLNLGESLCIFTFFLFPDSGLNLLNDFDFFFLFLSILNHVTLKTSHRPVSYVKM